MLKEHIKLGLVLFTAVFFASACASIQLGPTMGPLEETVLEGEAWCYTFTVEG